MKPLRSSYVYLQINILQPIAGFRFLLLNVHNYKLIEKMHYGAGWENAWHRSAMNANLNLVSYDNILLLLQTTLLYRQVTEQI
jgi:hypothetical protein